jgi:hypothetical protein
MMINALSAARFTKRLWVNLLIRRRLLFKNDRHTNQNAGKKSYSFDPAIMIY